MLYSHVYHEGLGAIFAMFDRLEPIFGGLSEVRTIHHLCMNYILIFVPIHVYMVIFNSIKGRNGSVDSIVNGYKSLVSAIFYIMMRVWECIFATICAKNMNFSVHTLSNL